MCVWLAILEGCVWIGMSRRIQPFARGGFWRRTENESSPKPFLVLLLLFLLLILLEAGLANGDRVFVRGRNWTRG